MFMVLFRGICGSVLRLKAVDVCETIQVVVERGRWNAAIGGVGGEECVGEIDFRVGEAPQGVDDDRVIFDGDADAV